MSITTPTIALPKIFSASLLDKSRIARDVMELRLERPADFVFAAGQFVRFIVPDKDGAVWRNYSISSSPAAEYLEFCVKILPDGKASEFFSRLAIGERANFSAARGHFVCQPRHWPAKIFIATGTGLAPLASMIAEQAPSGESLRLLFGVRDEADIFWFKKLNDFASHGDTKILLTLSQPGATWSGARGRVTDYIPQFINLQAEYYICGSVEMVRESRARLISCGIPAGRIHIEIF